jgi:hypothetical protein
MPISRRRDLAASLRLASTAVDSELLYSACQCEPKALSLRERPWKLEDRDSERLRAEGTLACPSVRVWTRNVLFVTGITGSGHMYTCVVAPGASIDASSLRDLLHSPRTRLGLTIHWHLDHRQQQGALAPV